MKQQNAWAKAWANAERSVAGGERARAWHRRYCREAQEYLAGRHLFARTFSDVETGERRVMTGRAAKDLNDDLFAQFLAAVEKDVPGRSLEKWSLVTKFVGSSNAE